MDRFLQIGLSNAAVIVLAPLVLPLVRLLRQPALTHALCLLILLKLITPPLWTIPIDCLPAATAARIEEGQLETAASSRGPRGATVGAGKVVTMQGGEPSLEWRHDATPEADAGLVERQWATWRMLGASVWLCGSAICFVIVSVRVRLLRRLLRFATPAPPEVLQRAEALAPRFDLATVPSIWFVPGNLCPILFGLWRPRLIVSAKLWDRLEPRQQDTLLLHELAHYRRGDHWVRPLEVLITALYWWHPVVWWTRSQLREAEEQCCDAWVLWGLPGVAHQYASALLEVVDFASETRAGLPVLASGMGDFRHLKRRLNMMKQSVPRMLSWTSFAGLCSLAIVLLPMAPVPAQYIAAPSGPGNISTGDPATEVAFLNVEEKRTDKDPDIDEAKLRVEQLTAELAEAKAKLAEREALQKASAETENSASLTGEKQFSATFHWDFRKDQPLEEVFKVKGSPDKVIARDHGFRVSLPSAPCSTSLITRFFVSGDFDVTARCEVLNLEKPGAAAYLLVESTLSDENPRLGRKFGQVHQQEVIAAFEKAGADDWSVASMKATDVNLRLKREGERLQFFAGDAQSGSLRKLREVRLSGTDPRWVRLVVANKPDGGQADVRWLELTIKADQLLGR